GCGRRLAMDEFRSELKDAFQRRLDAAPMRPDLGASVAQRVAEPRPRREPLALATALAVVLMIAVVGTFLYVSSAQRTRSTPASPSTPVVSPTQAPSAPSTPAAPAPRFQPYSYLRSNANAGFMTTGHDGAVWLGEAGPPTNYIARISSTGAITEHPVTTPVSYPQSLVAGPDGAIWFTEQSGKIGRISVAGQLTKYSPPTANSVPEGITVGPDGALWFTQRGA